MPISIHTDLIHRYDRPGPRYTSYPTAPHFSSDFTDLDWELAISDNNRTSGRDLSLYVHIPFCDTLCWFCGCTTIISRRKEVSAKYVEALIREIDLYADRMHPERRVVQIHWGGGTPTHLSPEQIQRVGQHIQDRFRVSVDAEISCEMDPRGLENGHLEALRCVGFNRASIGVQDFNPEVQKAINRVHDEALVRRVVERIRAAGFASINMDLIYGLPHQTPESFAETLRTIRTLNPDRLAVFSYAHVPWMMPHQKLIHDADLPDPAEKARMLAHVVESLTQEDWTYIGMDHFARSTDALAVAQQNGTLQRNFQGYSTRSGVDIYAFGMSSISQLPATYAQHSKNLSEWYDHVDAGRLPVAKGLILSPDDVRRRHVIMRLMCDMRLDFRTLSEQLGIDFPSEFSKELTGLHAFLDDGLLVETANGLRVTDTGRLFVRNMAMQFDAYLSVGEARYSRTV